MKTIYLYFSRVDDFHNHVFGPTKDKFCERRSCFAKLVGHCLYVLFEKNRHNGQIALCILCNLNRGFLTLFIAALQQIWLHS